jgi:hypothetical protein
VGVSPSAELVGVSVQKLEPVAGDLVVIQYPEDAPLKTVQAMAKGVGMLARELDIRIIVLPRKVRVEHLNYTDPDVLAAVGQDYRRAVPYGDAPAKLLLHVDAEDQHAAGLLREGRAETVERVVKFLRFLWDSPDDFRMAPPGGLNKAAMVALIEDHCFLRNGSEAVLYGGSVGIIISDHNAPHSYRVAFPWSDGGEILTEVAAGQLRRVE